jgi:glycosyltransferase involved in cell wall biosynthesis
MTELLQSNPSGFLQKISVVIPVYNGERFLGGAIQSVLQQKGVSVEILVIDDGSSDKTAEIARGFGDRIRLIQQPNRGAAAARNRGIRESTAEILGFLDADDLYAHDKLSMQLLRLEQNPQVEIVMGQRKYLMLEKDLGEEVCFADYPDEHLSLQFGCGLFRRRVFERIGPLAENMKVSVQWPIPFFGAVGLANWAKRGHPLWPSGAPDPGGIEAISRW